MVVCGLKQLEVHLPHDSDPEQAVVQELVDALLDLLGRDDSLHHDAVIRLVLRINTLNENNRSKFRLQ